MKKYAKDIDKERIVENEKKEKSKNKPTEKRKIKRTTIQTLPYEKFINKTTLLLQSNVKIGKRTANLYSKTYLVTDANYSSLTEAEQEEKLGIFIQLLNGFDSSISLQLSIINKKIDSEEFNSKVLLSEKNDELNDFRREFNEIISEKVLENQNNLQSSRYITVTVVAKDIDVANNRFFTIEEHLAEHLKTLGSDVYLLDANERIKLLGSILRPEVKIDDFNVNELNAQKEKQEIAPDYFEFKKDYFMYDDKFCRCLYFRKLSTSIRDTIYTDLLGINRELIIAENLDFVDKDEALKMIERKITDMQSEKITKANRSANRSKGMIVDTITDSKLDEDNQNAVEFKKDIASRGQNMIRGQFIIMLSCDSYEKLQIDTEAIEMLLRRYQIETINAPYRQEVAFSSVLPVGNSNSVDKKNNLQFRRVLSTESVAGFMPFNCVELLQENGVYFGVNKMSNNPIIFDRNTLHNPNAFIFGIPGTGKSVTAKLEILYSMLAFDDEIIIIDPEREYTALVQLLGGEVIFISQSSATHINPLDLVENPDPKDTEYDPITAKLDLLLSFFSAIMGDKEITPLQRTVIDEVMREMYEQYDEPTLKEFYVVLEEYETKCTDAEKQEIGILKPALKLYVTGSMNLFSNKSNVNTSKRLICYDTKSLTKNLQTLGMTIVMENVWGKLAKNRAGEKRTRIYVDEMYLMFKSETTSQFFFELYKRARKWGGMPTGITQNVEDVLRSANARAMINSTEFVLMLSQNTADREELSKLLTIPYDTMRYVTNAKQGNGLIHISQYGDIPFNYEISTDSLIYKTITTKFKEEQNNEKISC